MPSFSNRLANAVLRHGPLCVGLDPRVESLPLSIRSQISSPTEAIQTFLFQVLELIRPHAGIVKPQSAFFEQHGPEGMAVLQSVQQRARAMGFVTILDAKRGDIASTATAYATAAFGLAWNADSLTVNPYLGEDAIEPFIAAARAGERGLFVLVRTSNPGAGLFQDRICEGQPLYRHVAKAVARWNEGHLTANGLGDIGAVVGATHPAELRELREVLPQAWFLVPGYGAQGGTTADVQPAFRKDGLGAVVNSSRGVTFPFAPDDPQWESRIIDAAVRASRELKQAAGLA